MRVAVTGASGFIGTALVDSLRRDGHEVVRLVRREVRADDEVSWDPPSGRLDPDDLAGVDAAVNLSGANIGARRWTEDFKRTLYDSRIDSTRLLAETLAAVRPRPDALVSSGGADYYADTGDRPTDESGPVGDMFLSRLVRDWEAATEPASRAGIRVATTRNGLVLGQGGGAMARLGLPFRLGVGGRLGSGRQYWGMVSLADAVRAFRFLVDRDDLSGAFNVTVPEAPTNAELTRALGRAFGRPTPFPVPVIALRVALGEFAWYLLANRRIVPRRLLDAGFTFDHGDTDAVARYAVSTPDTP